MVWISQFTDGFWDGNFMDSIIRHVDESSTTQIEATSTGIEATTVELVGGIVSTPL